MTVMDGERAFSILLRKTVSSQGSVQLLSPREGEVLSGIAYGLTNREIGQWLGISSRTVEIHRMHAIQKLAARNSADAVRIAIGAGFQFHAVPEVALAAAEA